ncbi:lysozyme g-like isoform X1 [Hemibagrus wyckioides]|uniref:lysozyme g-like isoform X1 n=2 Tax=Hemibagrus wyckioides TaxID=337641 RepID=UPI00266CE30D|nr:lysozyme g-like isoform X1 [Hemibagrus wyckioides]
MLFSLGREVTTSNMACIYGDITKISTTGASEKTARQDKLTVKGVEASHKLAENDLRKMEQYKNVIIKVGRAKQMDPAVIAGIISRESRAGSILVNGWGDHGNGFGLMQVDKNHHTPKGAWNSEEHLTQGTDILIQSIKDIQKKFPSWPKEHQFKGGIAAYNLGPGNVRTYERMDIGSPGDDYSSDVVARAQFFKRKGY